MTKSNSNAMRAMIVAALAVGALAVPGVASAASGPVSPPERSAHEVESVLAQARAKAKRQTPQTKQRRPLAMAASRIGCDRHWTWVWCVVAFDVSTTRSLARTLDRNSGLVGAVAGAPCAGLGGWPYFFCAAAIGAGYDRIKNTANDAARRGRCLSVGGWLTTWRPYVAVRSLSTMSTSTHLCTRY
jgi:hypothetical protein